MTGLDIYTLENIFYFIDKVDIEVIEHAIKKGRKKHLNYAINTLIGLVKEGKTTKESVSIVPINDKQEGANNHARTRGSPERRDNFYDQLSL